MAQGLGRRVAGYLLHSLVAVWFTFSLSPVAFRSFFDTIPLDVGLEAFELVIIIFSWFFFLSALLPWMWIEAGLLPVVLHNDQSRLYNQPCINMNITLKWHSFQWFEYVVRMYAYWHPHCLDLYNRWLIVGYQSHDLRYQIIFLRSASFAAGIFHAKRQRTKKQR